MTSPVALGDTLRTTDLTPCQGQTGRDSVLGIFPWFQGHFLALPGPPPQPCHLPSLNPRVGGGD